MNHAFKNASMIFEHIQLIEAESEDVVVAGFETNNNLESNVWDSNNLMKSDVSKRLIAIADDFISGLPFDIDVEDIKLTGSLATYSWSKFSDVDLHIVVDFSQVDDDEELVRDYFNAKKTVWNLRHEIYIYDYEVEIYIENVGDKHIAQGIYSILNNDWIKEPSRKYFEIDIDEVQKKAASIMSQIEHVENIAKEDPVDGEKLSERMKEKIRKMRQTGLDSKTGIYSVKNIAFKVLRRNGYLERLSNVKTQSYDRAMSLASL